MSWMEKRRRALMAAAAAPALVLDPVFANNDWAAIIAACQRRQVPDTWVVGDQKKMDIGMSFTIDIIGKDHDTYADGSGTAPLTLQVHEVYSLSYAMRSDGHNTDGWENSIVRTTAMSEILSAMPDEVRAAVREVSKLTGAGSASTTIVTTADKLFIPSQVELFGKASLSAPGEGTQYEYYTLSGKLVKYARSGANVEWWTRSPVVTSTSNYVRLYRSGSAYSAEPKKNSYVAAAWCF